MKNSCIGLLVLAGLLLTACNKKSAEDIDPSPVTKYDKGVFGLRDAALLTDLGARYTRMIIWDTDIAALFAQVDNGIPLDNIPQYQQLKSISDSGIKLIITLRWPDQSSADPNLYDRVPVGQDRVNALALLKRFLNEIGPLMAIYSVQNEVGGLGPGTYSTADMIDNGGGSNAVRWWQEIVATVKAEQQLNPALANLQISSPTAVLLKRMALDPDGLPSANVDFFYETITFDNQYCDFLDFHFNTIELQDYPTVLAFLRPLVSKPMITTEWSEVESARNYLGLTISPALYDLAGNLGFSIPASVTTNAELVDYLYANPGNISFWQAMVNESGYSTGFMQESAALLADTGFEILCWNSGWQEGLPEYDLRSFYVTLTVAGPDNAVTGLINEFKGLP